MQSRFGLEIPSSVVRRLIQRAGIPRVRDSAADLWRDFLEQLTIQVFSKLKKEKGIERLDEEHVKEILKTLKKCLDETIK
jgi:histone H3/H4